MTVVAVMNGVCNSGGGVSGNCSDGNLEAGNNGGSNGSEVVVKSNWGSWSVTLGDLNSYLLRQVVEVLIYFARRRATIPTLSP